VLTFRRLIVLMILLLAGRLSVAADLDPKTGLVLAPGIEVVSAQCTVCHSAKLISQNRAMGENEGPVLDYLAANYGPLSVGRRRPLPPGLLPPP
jgi:hypothetical protein